MSPAVVRGKHLWDSSNCMGCHTLLGEGGYYAPELTRVFSRRGESFIRQILADPAAMYPGQRQMQQYHFTEAQISDLVAFLEWINGMDLNGFPAPPTITAAGSAAPSGVTDNRPRIFVQTCIACHAVDGRGGRIGPALDGVATRFNDDYLRRWLRDPAGLRPGTQMPNLRLTDPQIDELVTYLSTLGTRGQP